MSNGELTHDEMAELLGVYALDAVDSEEAAAVEAHLHDCPRCAAEVADHREVAAMLAYTGAPAPEGVWTKIVESLEEPPPEMNLPISTPAPEQPSPQPAPVTELATWRDRRRWIPMGAVAAAFVVIGLVAGVLVSDARDVDAPQELPEFALDDLARAALNDPSSTRVDLKPAGAGTLSAVAAVRPDGSGFLLGNSLPALDESETYQLWGIRGDEAVSLGVLGNSPNAVGFQLDEGFEALAITAEVRGGVPQSENPAVLFGSFA